MSRKGDCYDNAPMESFFHTLKTELVHHSHHATRADATRVSLPISRASTIEPVVYQPDRDGAKSSLTQSIISEEDHYPAPARIRQSGGLLHMRTPAVGEAIEIVDRLGAGLANDIAKPRFAGIHGLMAVIIVAVGNPPMDLSSE